MDRLRSLFPVCLVRVVRLARICLSAGFVLSLPFMVGGCSSPMDQGPFAQWMDHDPAAASWSAHDQVSGPAHERSHTSRTTVFVPPGPADGPEVYVQLALERNPSILAARENVRRVHEMVTQARSFDDPMLQVAPVGQMAETAAGRVMVQTSLSQKLPFFGKRDTRGRIAQQQVVMAMRDLTQAKLDVIARTRKAWWREYTAARSIEIIGQSKALLNQFHAAALAKYETGAASQQEVLQASTDLSNLENDLLTLKQRQQTAQAMLNQLMNRPTSALLSTPAVLPDPIGRVSALPSLNQMLAQAAQHNPKLGKAHDQIEVSREQLKLAKLNYWPDLTLNGHYNFVDDDGMSMAANGKDQWALGFGINLPIWYDKLKAGENQALRGIAQGVATLTAAQNRVAYDLQDVLARVQTQQRSVELLAQVILPQAKQAVDVSAAGYQSGSVDFLSLITNWRKLLDLELLHQQSISQYHQDLADLQRVLGSDLPETLPPTTHPFH